METKVMTKVYDITSEEDEAEIRLNKTGATVTKGWLEQGVSDGCVYVIQQATPDTLLTGSATYAATDPAIIFTVPKGVTVIPHYLMVSFEDTTDSDNYVTVGFAPQDLYISGGLASSTANNLNTSDPRKSNISDIFNGDTAIVMKDPAGNERICYTKCVPFVDINTSEPYIAEWKPSVPPVLVGPATFFTYIYGQTAPEFQFTLQYSEHETKDI